MHRGGDLVVHRAPALVVRTQCKCSAPRCVVLGACDELGPEMILSTKAEAWGSARRLRVSLEACGAAVSHATFSSSTPRPFPTQLPTTPARALGLPTSSRTACLLARDFWIMRDDPPADRTQIATPCSIRCFCLFCARALMLRSGCLLQLFRRIA